MAEIEAREPYRRYHGLDLWLDEQLWGHRLWDQQNPWLLFLEFLGVAEACHREGRLFAPLAPEAALLYRPAKRMHLRNVLFNNGPLFDLADAADSGRDDAGWRDWLAWMRDFADGVPEPDFKYLRDEFVSFREFAVVVRLMVRSVVETETARRWHSQFVFPFGPHALYEDLNVKRGSTSREYIHFGRTGELLYQMLSRSAVAAPLRDHFARAFDRPSEFDGLVKRLQPEGAGAGDERTGGYLPHARHDAFEYAAEDWLALLDVGLPGLDAYPHLATLGALHVLLYQLRVAADVLGQQRPALVCEIVAPKKTVVRELAARSFQTNAQLSEQAVAGFVDGLRASERWQRAEAGEDAYNDVLEIVRGAVHWEKYEGRHEPEALYRSLRDKAVARHAQHAGNVHRNYGRWVGLVSRRGTNRLRYAPNDALLKTLVLTSVRVRMDFGEFLWRLYERYGFVIGHREAERALGGEDLDRKAFQANARRLEARLRSLGMLRRLSDGCAYVENPYGRQR